MATVNEGRDNVVELIGAGLTADGKFGSVGIGSDSTAVSDSDSSLGTTVDTQTGLTAGQNGNTMSLVATFTNNSSTIRESTIYCNTNTVLLARQILSTINVQSSDTLEMTWEVNVS